MLIVGIAHLYRSVDDVGERQRLGPGCHGQPIPRALIAGNGRPAAGRGWWVAVGRRLPGSLGGQKEGVRSKEVLVGAALGIAIAALVVLIVALGLSPIFFAPVAVVALVIVLRPIFGSLYGRSRRQGTVPTPTTTESSYEPVTDPAER